MIKEKKAMKSNFSRTLVRQAIFALIAGVLAAQSPQKVFDTPEKAAESLIAASERGDSAALLEIFGPEGKDFIDSGDPVRDKSYVQNFAAMAKEKKAVVTDPQNHKRAILAVGPRDWPLPIPIVQRKGKWSFDTKAGHDEILYRRIGANELDAIQVCRGFVEAQKEYALLARDVSGTSQYAQRIISSPGKRDGLYWKNDDGSPGGPISETVARAIEEGYTEKSGPYHGYYFRVLKGQGPAAPLGELDYVINGLMIGGFALIATPAEYGVSGIKTFIVSHDGIVYEKDLGKESLQVAKATERYNPDKTWRPTYDEWPLDTGN